MPIDAPVKRRPGRPKKFGEPLVAREILVPESIDLDAVALADAGDVSVSEIYRGWINRGRKQKGRGK